MTLTLSLSISLARHYWTLDCRLRCWPGGESFCMFSHTRLAVKPLLVAAPRSGMTQQCDAVNCLSYTAVTFCRFSVLDFYCRKYLWIFKLWRGRDRKRERQRQRDRDRDRDRQRERCTQRERERDTERERERQRERQRQRQRWRQRALLFFMGVFFLLAREKKVIYSIQKLLEVWGLLLMHFKDISVCILNTLPTIRRHALSLSAHNAGTACLRYITVWQTTREQQNVQHLAVQPKHPEISITGDYTATSNSGVPTPSGLMRQEEWLQEVLDYRNDRFVPTCCVCRHLSLQHGKGQWSGVDYLAVSYYFVPCMYIPERLFWWCWILWG